MCASVEEVLKTEFGLTLGSKGVNILDPCTGTGNFIVNLIRRIPKRELFVDIAVSIGQQQPIRDYFTFERLAAHLKTTQHRAAAIYEHFAFKQSVWNRDIAKAIP